jgi:lysophospholipase L1-like esterase
MIDRSAISTALVFGLAIGLRASEPTSSAAKGDVRRVACVGDSITFGHTIPDREHKSYPAMLAKLLGAGVEVRNFGVNGATVLKHGTRPYSDQQAYRDALAFKPQFVVLMLGTNDTNKKSWPDYHDQFSANYQSLIDDFHKANPTVQIWLCTPPPLFRDRGLAWDTDAISKDQIEPQIKELAKQNKCRLIDVYSLFADKSALFPDGVHPNAAGAEVLAGAVERELAPQFADILETK